MYDTGVQRTGSVKKLWPAAYCMHGAQGFPTHKCPLQCQTQAEGTHQNSSGSTNDEKRRRNDTPKVLIPLQVIEFKGISCFR
jgi:hypothetical protein